MIAGLFARMVSLFAPESAPARREFKAGRVDMMRSDWPTLTRPPDADIRYALQGLRSRARHEAQNNDHARAFLREVRTNVIGPHGVRLQSKATTASGRPDERARRVIEDGWRDWGRVGCCDITGELHWKDVQNLAVETLARDGEMFYRIRGDLDTPCRYGLQAMDAETLDVEYNAVLPTGNVVIMGVELDANNRRVAYHFSETDRLHLSYRPTLGRGNRARVSIPADQIIHLYLPEWVLQTRGVPWMSTALRRMTDLNGYDESAVVAARAGASKMGWIMQGDDAAPTLNPDGTPTYQLADAEGSDGQLYSAFDPGSIGVLPMGHSFSGWDPKYPHAEHGSFTKAVLRGIAAGLGVNYNTLAMDAEGVNYSTMRHFALADRAVWMCIQEWLIAHFHDRVYREWLAQSLQMGTLRDPRGRPLSPAREAEFQRVHWQPRRWPWVDPKNDAQTAQLEIDLRVRSRSSVIRERGDDPDEVWEEIRLENERLEELGISPAQATAAAVSVPDDEPEPDAPPEPAAPDTETDDDADDD